ncbi:hypothetical protein PE36_00070 [Moritella sp. PE36]|uniref:hypothetical protein n=1 Tax=Moritella sp. PE36 TaxID=58051 RepID=UPI000156914A|nr:hypothetical protein [Moritella sp. PE36]EDM66145.1 hypothetical protein PE36_00070 [Moritella sp. PE36]
MPLQITSNAIGVDHLNKALKGMTDERGLNWKRTAMLRAGKDAFNVVNYAARNKSPFATGLTKRSLTLTKGIYNKIGGKVSPISKSGKVKKGKKQEYRIATTLKESFNDSAPEDRKGRPVRYPFMNEVGVAPQTYARVSTNGKLHLVKRKAPRKQLLFQHRALGQNADKVVSIWIRKMDYYLSFYAKSTYATLKSAERNFRRTGGQGNRWR